MENGNASARDPSGFLTQIIGSKVTVKLNSGLVYKGIYTIFVSTRRLSDLEQENCNPWTAT